MHKSTRATAFRPLALGALTLSVPALGASASGLAMGTYRAVLTLPAGELPFGLELEAKGTATVGYLLNGKES